MSTWGAADDPGDQYEADRCAIAKLLDARGHAEAAAIVAVSVYRPDLVDNWNGGQYEAVLEGHPSCTTRPAASSETPSVVPPKR
ncbi:Uncharacterised protein [Mycobacteroides abscessus]|nr:Uncharacterised protein [Mycobacteroides abscessus]